MDFKVGDKVRLVKNESCHPKQLFEPNCIGTIVVVLNSATDYWNYGVDFHIDVEDDARSTHNLQGLLPKDTGRNVFKHEIILVEMPEIKVFKNPRYKELFT